MRSCLVASALLLVPAALTCASQSSNPGAQSGSEPVKSVAQSSAGSAQDPTERPKKKPKKVWTNDEISKVGGNGSISVVGASADPDTKPSSQDDSTKTNASSLKERQVAAYRERLHQLHNELETTEKKISELRNFKAENTSASGGIDMNRRYTLTPVEDQIKRLEEKKKQLQIQIDALEDQ